MRFPFALTLLVPVMSLFGSDQVEPPRPAPLACKISSDPTCEMGKSPKIEVKITNQTGKEILLISSLDGSDCKMRYPHVYFEVIGPDGKSAVKAIGRCGNTNPLSEKDFVKVAPKGTFSPYAKGFDSAHQLSPENFDRAGKYRIKFHYSTEAKDALEFGERPRSGRAIPAELVKMLDRVPKATVTSNEVVVEVKKR